MEKYLVVKCRALGDQWECDADRTPLCITSDPSEYGIGYDVWKINPDGSLEKIKDYNDPIEEGMALYAWDIDADPTECRPEVLEKYPAMTRKDCTISFLARIIEEYEMEDSLREILQDIRCSGSHGEEIGSLWLVFGEYRDNHFSCGF